MMSCRAPSAPPPPPTFHSKDSTPTTAISASSAASNLPYSRSPIRWSTGLCDCCDDVSSCCLTCWCPCVTFGRLEEIVDRGSTSCGVSGALYMLIMVVSGCSCLYSCFYRSKMRGIYFLEETPCTDCCVHCCCEQCALCQEYRQLQNHGFDLSIGWYGNMERQKRGVAVPPALQDGMNRRI